LVEGETGSWQLSAGSCFVHEILSDVRRWEGEGKSVALATVIQTWGSAARPAGSKMAVSDAADMAGSVSGGCVESAVVEEALGVLKTGRPRLLRYGVSDEAAWEVGLTCGGSLTVFVEPLLGHIAAAPDVQTFLQDRSDKAAVRAVVIQGPEAVRGQSGMVDADGRLSGGLDPNLAESVRAAASLVEKSGAPETKTLPFAGGQVEVFFDPLMPPFTLVIVGAVHIAIALTRLAKVLDYRVVLVDPRRAFITRERFPEADSLIGLWPDEALRQIGLNASTAVAVLSHDPKLDDPALQVALPSSAFYVGALGSEATNEQRRRRLLEAGLKEQEVARLHAPIGIDVGSVSPEEIAVSILAEVVAARRVRKPERPSRG
jgi:xanthine dehydrogenase accessory factor